MGIIESLIIAKSSIRRSFKMNKKGWIIAAAIALLLCTVAVYLVFFVTYKTATFPSKSCEYFFGCTASEFSTAELDLPDEVLSLQRNTNINSEGSLVSNLSLWQWYRFKNSEWITDFSHLEDWPCIYLSEDYYSVTVTVTPEMKTYDSVKLKALEDAVNTTFYRIRLIDMINNNDDVHNPERVVIYKEIDSVTGETLYEGNIIVSRQLMEFMIYNGWE